MSRATFVVVALLTLSSAADAQITTFIAPPKPIMTPQMVAAADSAKKDSVAVLAVTNMKAWVDSAAGITVPESVGDSAVVDPGKPDVVTTFSNGTIAPHTASALPSLGLFGLVAAFAGVALLMRKRGSKLQAALPARAPIPSPVKPRD